jgi:3-oxoacyl-[acyl-carrier-protein] synthase II
LPEPQGSIDAVVPAHSLGPDPAEAQEALTRFVDKRKLRRLDQFSRLAVLAAFLAIEDAGRLVEERQNLGLLVSTGYGAAQTTFEFLDSIINDGDRLASPTHFSQSVHNAAAANAGQLLGATGPSLTVCQFDRPFAAALATAKAWALEGRITHALVGGVEGRCQTLAQCLERLAQVDSSLPAPRQGEGAVFLLLEARSGDADEASGYGRIDELTPLSPSRRSALRALCGVSPAFEAFEFAAAALLGRRGSLPHF